MLKLTDDKSISLLLLLLVSSLFQPVFAKSKLRKQGDWISDNMMWVATAQTLYREHDSDDEDYAWGNGLVQLHVGAAIPRAFIVTNTKRIIDRTREDGSGDGFPSGHASKAFYPAWYIYHRYGFKESIPYLMAAIYSGYSRVDAKRHYWSDIIGSAVITFVVSHYMTSSYDNPNQPRMGLGFNRDGWWLNYNWCW